MFGLQVEQGCSALYTGTAGPWTAISPLGAGAGAADGLPSCASRPRGQPASWGFVMMGGDGMTGMRSFAHRPLRMKAPLGPGKVGGTWAI